MVKEHKYFVVGGIFTSGAFSAIEPGSGVIAGPFETEEKAELYRDGATRKNLDICWYKLWTVCVDFMKNE